MDRNAFVCIYMDLRASECKKSRFYWDNSSIPRIPRLQEQYFRALHRSNDGIEAMDVEQDSCESDADEEKADPNDVSYPLCLRGLDAWDGEKDGIFVTFLSSPVAEQLKSLLSPWWDVMEKIDGDLEKRRKVQRKYADLLSDDTLRRMAKMVLREWFYQEISKMAKAKNNQQRDTANRSATRKKNNKNRKTK